ncbi:hypothetical protein QC764_401107 [Podospora pseudoanserina]|uniref:Uncharacterized protein n=1 Tax=Podospora pseudoanserina TaxID=2609844 RepID=A0ABR0I7Z6_9PEZI|nr:hypothetical protein QC764_401107 [Podospora pseudoanserina]
MVMAAPRAPPPSGGFHPESVSSTGIPLAKRFNHTPNPSKSNLCREANPQYHTSEPSPKASDCWEIPTESSPTNIPGYWTLNSTEAGSDSGTYDVKFYIDAHTRQGYDEEGRIEVASPVTCDGVVDAEWAVAHV